MGKFLPGCSPGQNGGDPFRHTIAKRKVLGLKFTRTNKHPGNIEFRQKARELKPWYDSVSTKEEKYDISVILMESVTDEGHRFLEKGSDGLWYEVIGNGPRKKASQALRQRINIKRSSAKGRENDPGGQCDVRRPGSGQCAGIDRGH